MTFRQKLHSEIENAKKALQEDIADFGVVGSGFWEATELNILAILKEFLDCKQKHYNANNMSHSSCTISELLRDLELEEL